jgi:hypothetical protein
MTRNLLFTSAGNNCIIDKYWIDNNRKYDIFVCYYGNNPDKPLMKYADYYAERKGGKFQNFYFFWQQNPQQPIRSESDISIQTVNPNKKKFNIKDYDYYFIVDDDIIISTTDINRLFLVISSYNLDIIQPSFPIGKNSRISHEITVSQPELFMRYTNFIEVNTPVFSKSALEKCMKIYEPSLVGFGVDYLFLWFLGHTKEDKYAIIDHIKCINPFFEEREIDKLQTLDNRYQNWKEIAKKHNITCWKHKNYKALLLNPFNSKFFL